MNRFWFYSLVIIIALIGWFLSESSERVAILFTGITACFSYEGYRYNKEKFRLELFEKRWEVYEKVLIFQEIFLKNSGLAPNLSNSNKVEIDKAHDAARYSFADIGWHRSRCLFGEDVVPLFDKLEQIYAFRKGEVWDEHAAMTLCGTPESKAAYNKDIEDVYDSVRKIYKTFTPYLYFGDYKSPQPTPHKNLCELCVLCSKKITLTIAKYKKFITCSKT
jgi:hypothetical protein